VLGVLPPVTEKKLFWTRSWLKFLKYVYNNF
jgi:hypothetical protein